MDHSLFIHSHTKGHLGCFQVLAIMNKGAINIHVQVLYGQKFPTPLGKHQGAQLLDHMPSMFSFVRIFLPNWRYHFASPSATNESSCCSTASPAFGAIGVWIPATLRAVWWSLTVLLISLMTYDVEHLFMCSAAIYIPPLVRCL